jgi:DNA-binding IscR family transcriptional regulator
MISINDVYITMEIQLKMMRLVMKGDQNYACNVLRAAEKIREEVNNQGYSFTLEEIMIKFTSTQPVARYSFVHYSLYFKPFKKFYQQIKLILP